MAANSATVPRLVRCAIYTRKSTEDGLDQAFNSLDAQREAGESYIHSQVAEGWQTLPHRYDDGGFTGSNMERPGLRKLVQDIEAGRIDCVVVYKVDRLSRSLLDFARLMSVFEKRCVTFVSVTQQFNTSTPVGRLTLHILLSFSEFEREIIRERTRDKKAAARRKGKWIGGYVPLGYDLDARGGRLIVNEAETEQVRAIYGLFAANRSLDKTLEQIEIRGYKTKTWTTRDDKVHAGRPFTEASLIRLLTNGLYAGMVNYKGKTYRGEQGAIVDKRLWKRVQEIVRKLPVQSKPRTSRAKTLLGGLFYCGLCSKPMAYTATVREQRRYEYYVCRTRSSGCSGCSISAPTIETSVMEQVVNALHQMRTGPGSTRACKLRQAFGRDWRSLTREQLRDLIHSCVERVSYDGSTGRVSIKLREERRDA